jgi:LysR family transcriptional regulator, nitrogen assimilation regulatory protein
MAPLLAVPLMLRIQNRFPAVRLRFVEGFAPTLHDMVLKGEVDLAVLNGSVRAIDLVMEPLLREQMCLIGRSDDLRLNRKQISVGELTGIPLVMTGLAKSGVRLELEAVAARVGTELETLVEVESLDVAKRLVLAGIGLTVHFAAVVHEDVLMRRLTAVPIEELFLNRMIARAAGRPVSRATEALMGVLREVVENEVGNGRWPYATLMN